MRCSGWKESWSSVRGVEEAPGLRKRVGGYSRAPEVSAGGGIDRTLCSGLSGGRAGRCAGGVRNTYLQATPIDVSGADGRSCCLRAIQSVVLTSATLTVAGWASGISRKRLGMDDARRSWWCLRTSDYAEQALLYLPPEMPDPREPDFAATRRRSRSGGCSRLRGGGRSACLPAMRRCAICTSGCWWSWHFRCCCRARRRGRRCWRSFATTPNAVLFGTSSFWQGVDVQGEPLSCVIVDRLPFAVPTDPVVEARMRAIEEDGRQRVLRVPGAAGGDHAEAGVWAADPLARRSRRADAAGPADAAAEIWEGVSGQSAALSGDEGYCRGGAVFQTAERPNLTNTPVSTNFSSD